MLNKFFFKLCHNHLVKKELKDKKFILFLDFQGPLFDYDDHKKSYEIMNKMTHYEENYVLERYVDLENGLYLKSDPPRQFTPLEKELVEHNILCYELCDPMNRELIKKLRELCDKYQIAIIGISSSCTLSSFINITSLLPYLNEKIKDNKDFIKLEELDEKSKIKSHKYILLEKLQSFLNKFDEKEIHDYFYFKKTHHSHSEFLRGLKKLFTLRKETKLDFVGVGSTYGSGNDRMSNAIYILKELRKFNHKLTPIYIDDMPIQDNNLITTFENDLKGIYYQPIRKIDMTRLEEMINLSSKS